MKHYLGQKAQQALEELVKEDSLQNRLQAARLHTIIANNEHFIEDAEGVREALREIDAAFAGDNLVIQGQAISRFIEEVFQEYGANETLERLNKG